MAGGRQWPARELCPTQEWFPSMCASAGQERFSPNTWGSGSQRMANSKDRPIHPQRWPPQGFQVPYDVNKNVAPGQHATSETDKFGVQSSVGTKQHTLPEGAQHNHRFVRSFTETTPSTCSPHFRRVRNGRSTAAAACNRGGALAKRSSLDLLCLLSFYQRDRIAEPVITRGRTSKRCRSVSPGIQLSVAQTDTQPAHAHC